MSKYIEQTFFVGNLHFEATESDLTDAFRSHGYKVGTTKIARDKGSDRSMGFGFVTVLCDDEDAILGEMYGVEVLGRPIRVQVSTSMRPENKK